jgi:hypothetical protein
MRSPADHIADRIRARQRQRHRQAGAGIPAPIAAVPDAELIACLIEHGQPAHAARQLQSNPQLRLAALRFWVDVGDARRGDPAAKERVDYCRESWTRMRSEEIIADDPRRDPAHILDPADLL